MKRKTVSIPLFRILLILSISVLTGCTAQLFDNTRERYVPENLKIERAVEREDKLYVQFRVFQSRYEPPSMVGYVSFSIADFHEIRKASLIKDNAKSRVKVDEIKLSDVTWEKLSEWSGSEKEWFLSSARDCTHEHLDTAAGTRRQIAFVAFPVARFCLMEYDTETGLPVAAAITGPQFKIEKRNYARTAGAVIVAPVTLAADALLAVLVGPFFIVALGNGISF